MQRSTHRFRIALVGFALIAGASSRAQQPASVVRPGTPPGSVPVTAGSGAISGLVVDTETKAPIANAIVALGASGANPNQAQRLLSDARGRFVFRSLAARDNYTISVTKSGYFDGRHGVKGSRTASPIAISEGQWFADARVELVRPSAVSGTVVDEGGEPVVGAYVRALAQILVSGRPQLAVSQFAKTDDRGMYRIAGLSEGRYIITVPSVQNAVPADAPMADLTTTNAQSPGILLPTMPALALDANTVLIAGNYVTPPPATGGRTHAYPTHFYPGVLDYSDAAPVILETGRDRSGVDFQIRPVPTFRVSGRIEAPPGIANGLLLRLVPPGAESLGLGSETATALVTQNGQFTFLNVPAGPYMIDARRSFMEFRYRSTGVSNWPSLPAPGFLSSSGGGGTVFAAPEGTSYAHMTGRGDGSLWGRAEVQVSGQDVSNVVVPMRPTMTISGRVVRELTSGTQPSKPAATGSATLIARVEPASGGSPLGMPLGVSKDPNTFSVQGLLPGEYFLRVSPPAGGSVKSVMWDGKDFTYRPFDTSNGQDITSVVVTFTDQTASIAGTVPDSAALPNGAAVIAFPAEREQWSSYGFQPVRLKSVNVTNNGSYRIALPAGDYLLVAVDGSQVDAWQDPKFLESASRMATAVTLAWGEDKTQVLKVSNVK